MQSKQPNSANIIISLENTKNYRRKDDSGRTAALEVEANALPCATARMEKLQ